MPTFTRNQVATHLDLGLSIKKFRMTQLPSTPSSDSPQPSATEKSAIDAGNTSTAATTSVISRSASRSMTSDASLNVSSESNRHPIRAPQRPRQRREPAGSPWCKAMLYTVLIVFGMYIWLSWTDPDQVAMRQRAWDAAMERIRGKQVVYASRYSKDFRYRPAASPIITEALPDGRKRLRGARPGDDIPVPKPTSTSSKEATKNKKDRKKDRKKRAKKN